MQLLAPAYVALHELHSVRIVLLCDLAQTQTAACHLALQHTCWDAAARYKHLDPYLYSRCCVQETFDVTGQLLWWIRWLLPSRARRRGDGIFYPTVYNSSQGSLITLSSQQRGSAEVLIQHGFSTC